MKKHIHKNIMALLIVLIPLIFVAATALSGCGGPSQASAAGYSIPADYAKYTDPYENYSITFPSNWESDMSAVSNLAQNAEICGLRIKNNEVINKAATIFIVGFQGKNGFFPNMLVSVIPGGAMSFEQAVSVSFFKNAMKGCEYKQISKYPITLNGIDAMITVWEQKTFSGYCKMMSLVTMKNKTIWNIDCVSYVEEYDEWENDFNIIIRSFTLMNN